MQISDASTVERRAGLAPRWRFLLIAACVYALWLVVYEGYIAPSGRLDHKLCVNLAGAGAGLLRLLPQMKSGRFAADPCVEQLRATSVRVAQGAGTAYGDGEELGATPVSVDLVPAAVRVCLP